MSCTSPHVLLVSKFKNKDDKHTVRMVSPLEFLGQDFKIYKDKTEKYSDYNVALVPCGQCINCRLDYARNWATRCCLEALDHSSNCFITLTYSDDNLPKPIDYISSDGQFCTRSPVVKRDFQLFMKRLRKKYGNNIRFFSCGEYSPTGRPHYHAILFGCDFKDKKFFKRSPVSGDIIYTSNELTNLWPFGFSTIGECSFNTCNYVARYVVKKQKGNISSDEFCLMSRRPGLGFNYFYKNMLSLYDNSFIQLSNGLKASIPKYYDYLIDKFNLNKLIGLENIKLNRNINADLKLNEEIFRHSLGSLESYFNYEKDLSSKHLLKINRKEVK